MTRPADRGRIAAAVSIRSGRGSMTHDRVMRFTPLFDTHEAAAQFATDQALAWIGRDAHPCLLPNTPESESTWPRKT